MAGLKKTRIKEKKERRIFAQGEGSSLFLLPALKPPLRGGGRGPDGWVGAAV